MNSTKIKKVFKLSIGFLLNFICIVLIYLAGSQASFTHKESIIYDLSSLAGNGYVNLYQKERDGVEYFNRSNVHNIIENIITENNGSYSYNIFQSGLTYGYETGDIIIDSLGIYNDITFLVSSIFSNHTNNNEQIIMDAYYLELMFKESNTSYPGFDNFCYITKQQADYLIENNDRYSEYDSLLNETLEVRIDGAIYKWKIANIIIPFGEYYDGMIDVFDNFILCYLGLPNYKNISISHFYNDDAVVNFFKVDESLRKYKNEALEYSISSNCGYDINKKNNIENFFNGETDYNVSVFIVLFSFNLILDFIWMIYLFLNKSNLVQNSIACLTTSFFIYLFFYIMYHISNNIFLFSFLSNIHLLCFILASLIVIGYLFFTRGKQNVK